MPLDYQSARAKLVRELRAEIRDERVLSAMGQVERERFVPEPLARYAYDNRPLPIGHEQTISQPLMVAMMTQALGLEANHKVLEIGTGSGYQAALLSLLAREIVSVERVPDLATVAGRRLQTLGYSNVRVHEARDQLGWPKDAPYDAIIVTAAALYVPGSLVDQLTDGGRLVVPVGGRQTQQLVRATKNHAEVSLEDLGECRFVPLITPDERQTPNVPSPNGGAPAR